MGILEKLEDINDFYKRMDVVYNFGSRHVRAYPINIFLLTSKESVSIFEKINIYDRKFDAKLTKIEKNMYLMNYSRIWGEEKFVDYAYIFDYKDGWMIVNDNYKISPLKGLLKRLYPEISPSYLRSDDMYNLIRYILKNLDNNEVQTDIYYMTVKIPGEQTESIFRNVTINQMNEKINQSYLIDKIKLEIKVENRILFDGMLSRDGFCSFYNGDFSYFNDIIAKPILKSGMNKLDFFSNLIEIKSDEIISKPIELIYDQKFTPESFKELSKELQKIDTLSLSVIHEGNPMLLVHAIDIEDGSTFDITGVGKSLFLTPVLETSGASLLKTSEFISRSFREPLSWSYYGSKGEPGYSWNAK